MTTDPGDIVVDPTSVQELLLTSQSFGATLVNNRTSRVAMALARTRLMSAKFPFFVE